MELCVEVLSLQQASAAVSRPLCADHQVARHTQIVSSEQIWIACVNHIDLYCLILQNKANVFI